MVHSIRAMAGINCWYTIRQYTAHVIENRWRRQSTVGCYMLLTGDVGISIAGAHGRLLSAEMRHITLMSIKKMRRVRGGMMIIDTGWLSYLREMALITQPQLLTLLRGEPAYQHGMSYVTLILTRSYGIVIRHSADMVSASTY